LLCSVCSLPSLAQAQQFRGTSISPVSKDRVEYRAINKDGKIFDVYPPDSPGAKDAEKVFLSLAKPPFTPPGDPVEK
jgi:hypothetical protein